MKKLARFAPAIKDGSAHDANAVVMIPADTGAWVRHDDAMEALKARQDMVDSLTGRSRRYLRCVEAGDRVRAFLADYLKLAAKSGDMDEAEEATVVADLWDAARRKTMMIGGTNDQTEKQGSTGEAASVEDSQASGQAREPGDGAL